MSTTVKAADAAQFLSLIPPMLGFTPTQSVVLIPFSRGRSVGAMRLDLPPRDDPSRSGVAALARFASTCIGMVCRVHDADAVAAVMYTDASCCSSPLPHAELARQLISHAEACGLRVSDVLTVGSDGWGSHVAGASPPGGHPLSDIASPVVAGLPPSAGAGALAVTGDQSSGAALPRHDLAECEHVGRALDALRTAVQVLCGVEGVEENDDGAGRDAGADGTPGAPGAPPSARIDPRALEMACELTDLTRVFEDVVAWDTECLDPYEVAMLAWCLARPAMRDVALVQWCGEQRDGDAAFEAQRRWEDGAPYPADLAQTMWGEGPRPDPERLRAALEVCRHVASLAPRPVRAGALATCAWLSWALGRSSHAEQYAHRALEIEPEHGLSEIVLSFVAAAHLPDWAFRPR